MASVGIDLGTTNSCVAIHRDGQTTIILDKMGNRTIPSVVTYTEDDVLVGHLAATVSYKYPKTTIYEMKRLIGQNFDSDEIQEFISNCPYEVVDSLGLAKINVCHKGSDLEFYPEEVCSEILKELKKIAEDFLNEPVRNVVITVPAYFGEAQRNSTIDAGVLAEFENIIVINEPTAAVLAFQNNNPKSIKRTVLVYDFGGGTFDVTIAEIIGENQCKVLATKGDCFLGGTDVDMKLIEYVKNDVEDKFDYKINTVKILKRLKTGVEKAKKQLSTVERADIDLEGVPWTDDYNIVIKKRLFDEIALSTIMRTKEIIEACLEETGIQKSHINEIVLVGGSSRIPAVQQMLQENFPSTPLKKTVNPDEAVAYGAAIYASQAFENSATIMLSDVLSLSLGIEAENKKMDFLFRNNTAIPSDCKRCLRTENGRVCIRIYQGEGLVVKNNKFVSEYILAADNGNQKTLNVTFYLDRNGTLSLGVENSDTEYKIDMSRRQLDKHDTKELIKFAELNRYTEEKYLAFADRKKKFIMYTDDLSSRLRNHPGKNRIKNKIYKFRQAVEKLQYHDTEQINRFESKLQEMYNDRSKLGNFFDFLCA